MDDAGARAEAPRAGPTPHERGVWLDHLVTGAACYALTTAIVVAGIWFGRDFVKRQPHEGGLDTFLGAFANWDGQWYARIAREGYHYDAREPSTVAYSPAYPLAGRAVSSATGWPAEWSLLAVSHLCLLSAFVLLCAYVSASQEGQRAGPPDLPAWTALAFGLWPVSVFYRLAYTESLFLLVLLVGMYGMRRRWPAPAVALVVGLATACRPTGVAILAPFWWWLWTAGGPAAGRLFRIAALTPLASWGILAYMGYQQWAFGHALAFFDTQESWAYRPGMSWWDRWQSEILLRPIWGKFLSSSPHWWARSEPVANPLFSLAFFNPLVFVGTAALIAFGGRRGWLDRRELLLSAALLLIPYMSHSERVMMLAQARYSLVAFPAMLVLGQALARTRPPVSAAVLAVWGFLLGAYAALFATWYYVI